MYPQTSSEVSKAVMPLLALLSMYLHHSLRERYKASPAAELMARSGACPSCITRKVGHMPASTFEALQRAQCRSTSRLKSFSECHMSNLFSDTSSHDILQICKDAKV